MPRTKKVKSTGRFGTRYGSTIRKRVRRVEERSKATYKCPSCLKMALKREGLGIWKCTVCGDKRTGGAWDPITSAGKTMQRRVTRIAENLQEQD